MTTQLTPQQLFEEKLKDRIRENIGDLMPDALLSQMIARAMEEFLFKPVETKDSWGSIKERRDSALRGVITKMKRRSE